MKKLEHLYIPIGEESTAMGKRRVSVDVFLHTLFLGKSRTGKSTGMLQLIVGTIRADSPTVVIDPHGPLVDAVLNYIPTHRLKDVVLIDPTSNKVPGIGYFDALDKELAEQHFESNMEARSGRGWGARTAEVFRGAARAVLSVFKKPTLLHVYKFLVNDRFAHQVVSRSKDPLVKDFFQNWYSSDVKPRDRKEAFSHPRNKIDELLRPGIVEIVAQQNTLKWDKLLDSRKIILVKLPKGRIGANKAQAIGALVLMNIMLAGFHRKKMWLKCPVYIDEAHNFLAGSDVETSIAEAGKCGLVYHYASQTTTQLRDEERKIFNDEIILGNASSIVSFRIAGKDAKRLAEEFADDTMTRQLVELPNYTLYSWSVDNNQPILHGPVATLPAPEKRPDDLPAAQVLAWARENTGTEKSIVAAEVRRQLQESPADSKRRPR